MNNEIISAGAQELSGSEAENILKLLIPRASHLFFDSRLTYYIAVWFLYPPPGFAFPLPASREGDRGGG